MVICASTFMQVIPRFLLSSDVFFSEEPVIFERSRERMRVGGFGGAHFELIFSTTMEGVVLLRRNVSNDFPLKLIEKNRLFRKSKECIEKSHSIIVIVLYSKNLLMS
jgi:hypothetical protein